MPRTCAASRGLIRFCDFTRIVTVASFWGNRCNKASAVGSRRAKRRAQFFRERRDDPRGNLRELRFGERRLGALQRHASEERIFSRGNLSAAKQIDRFNAAKLRNAEC